MSAEAPSPIFSPRDPRIRPSSCDEQTPDASSPDLRECTLWQPIRKTFSALARSACGVPGRAANVNGAASSLKGCSFRFPHNPVRKHCDTPVIRQRGRPADDMRLAARHIPVRRHDAAKPLFRQCIVNKQRPCQNDAAALQGGRDCRTEISKRSPARTGVVTPSRSNHTGHDHSAPSFRPARPLCSTGKVPSTFGSRSGRPRGSRDGTATGKTISSNIRRRVDVARAPALGIHGSARRDRGRAPEHRFR